MINQWVLKILLAPFAMLYGLVILVRNAFYATGLLRGVSFSLPVISIGNLSVGGTGKTPHIEYLVRLLHEYLALAIVSRGYKRKTKGFMEVLPYHTALDAGDEPLQYKRKYPHVPVIVCESRSLAIPELLKFHPGTQVVLLDDGFQSLEINPGLNILLTEYNRLYTEDWLLPVGRLREWRDGAKRADVIVVTKCPENITAEEMTRVSAEVKAEVDQLVFFSRYRYGTPYKMYESSRRINLHNDLQVLLVVAIAGTEYLLEYVEERSGEVRMLSYNDHHPFSMFDVEDINRHFQTMEGEKIILTTEKDAIRLDRHREWLMKNNLPVYILPVAVEFLGDDKGAFDEAIKNWLLNFKV